MLLLLILLYTDTACATVCAMWLVLLAWLLVSLTHTASLAFALPDAAAAVGAAPAVFAGVAAKGPEFKLQLAHYRVRKSTEHQLQ